MLTDEHIQTFQESGYLMLDRLILGENLAYYWAVFDERVSEGRTLSEDTDKSNGCLRVVPGSPL